MKVKLIILSALLVFLIACKQSEPEGLPKTVTTYYLIRHAEKILADPENPNPDLTVEGYQRAIKWSEILQEIPFDAIYSTDFIRTQKTALPIAQRKSLQLISYDHKNLDYAKFINETQGKTVLIVGHSNSTPKFVNALIGKNSYNEIDETQYGFLFIVKRFGDTFTAEKLVINH